MFRLRLVLLASVACLVASQDTIEGTTTNPSDTTSTSDSPESTPDINSIIEELGPGVQAGNPLTTEETSTTDNSTSTEETSTTDSPENATTTSPSSAATAGVSVASLALLAIAVMS